MLPIFRQNEIQVINEHVDGEIRTRFIYEGNACPVIDLTSGNIGKNCAGLQLIIKDLDLVAATTKTAYQILIEILKKTNPEAFNLNDSNHIILWSLYSSAIITYGKCFTSAEERQVKLDISDFNKFEEKPGRPTLKELHTKILNLRHDWIAHGGKNDLERGKSLALLDPVMPDEREPTVLFHSRYNAIPSPQNLDDILVVTIAARDIAKLKLEKGEANLRKIEMSSDKMATLNKSAKDYVKFEIAT